jgi:integrase
MTQFQSRPVTTILSAPIPDGMEIRHPEQIILTFSNNQTIDIGSLCYWRRDRGKHRKQRRNKTVKDMLVDLASFDHARAQLIKRLIYYISVDVKAGRRSFYNYWYQAIDFINWLDDNGKSDAFDNEAAIRAAFSNYNKHIKERVAHSGLKIRSGAGMLRVVKTFLNGFLAIDDIDRGVNLLRERKKDSNETLPISESARKKILSLCDSLFKGITTLLVQNEPYPFWIDVPQYLRWARPKLWIFPTQQWCMAPHEVANRENLKKPFWAYNYEEGRLSTLQELIDAGAHEMSTMACHRDSNRHNAIRNARATIEGANVDYRHIERLRQAGRAHHAFVILFMLYTGMNFEQVKQLKWDENTLKTEVGRQGFRVVKWRAGGKEQYFEIQSRFYPDFKRFLELRIYMLGECDHEYLFLNLNWGEDSSLTPCQVQRGEVRNFYIQVLQRIDPSLPHVTSRQFRASKSDWLLRNDASPHIAATILQNEEETVKQSYTAGSPTVHQEEMTSFFDRLTSTVFPVVVCTEKEDTIEGPTGSCAAFDQPHAPNENAPWKPDCKNPEGCFWCTHYRVHADEKDVRKLYSCRFCIQRLSVMTGSHEEFEQRFGPVVDRIDQILDEVRPHLADAGLMKRIEYQVDALGELSDYWAAKFSMLIDLGVVTS